MRAYDLAASLVWAIQPEWLETILSIASRENESLEVLEARLGRPMDYTRTVTVRDGIAIIPVNGPIMRRANLFTRFSGGTSMDVLATDLRVALDSPGISGILLSIDSPGGEAQGTNELADMVFNARKEKPIVAYVGGVGASGAYWIASAAEEIVTDSIATLGSIGVAALIRDSRGMEEKAGIKSYEFVSSQSPNKRPSPDTESGRAQIQKVVDDIAAGFVASVARNRGVSEDKVLKKFGGGAVMVAPEAVKAGLADRMGSFESVLAEMASGKRKRKRMSATAETDNTQPETGNNGGNPMSKEKGFFARLFSGMSAEDKQEAAGALFSGEGGQSAQLLSTLPNSIAVGMPAAASQSAESEEVKKLREENAKLKADKFKAAAEEYVNSQIQACKIMPADKSTLVTVLAEAMQADESKPLAEGQSRVASIKAGIESRPAHKLTEETMKARVPAGARVLADSTDEDAEVKAEQERAAAYAASRNRKAS